MKAWKEMGAAFPSLVDEKGVRKPFEQFLKDVRKVDETYNKNYLRAEYEFAAASAEMAAKWERFMEDGDRYNLQYRTAGDDRVRPEHAALNGVTLPPTDEFWESYYPPNGWRCRCTVVQVRKKKYPETPHDEAMALGEAALDLDKKGMFRFNPGKQERVFPAYNAYTQEKCVGCRLGGKATLGKVEMAKEYDAKKCQACKLINECYNKGNKDARISAADVMSIIKMPIDEQFHVVYEGKKGKVHQHKMVCATREDYNRVLKVAKAFADMFGDCRINPEIMASSPEARRIYYPDLPEKCKANPDLTTMFGYIDVKSPHKNNNCCKNANHASQEQHACVCLTDDKMIIKKKQTEKISEYQINDRTNAIWDSSDYHHDYIFWFIGGVLRKYERPSDKTTGDHR